MDQRLAFLAAALRGERNMAALCRAFGISRETGYKWLNRYRSDGADGFEEKSRAPHHRPHQLRPEVAERIVDLRERHPHWGPRKLRARLLLDEPDERWPAASTIGELLHREGLIRPRRRRSKLVAVGTPRSDPRAPNDLWCADFKGHFCTGDGQRCNPLTMTDAMSRYLLRCIALPNEATRPVQAVFTSAFREYGLPTAMRSDNGPPFSGPGGLSSLSVWLLRLGIRVEYIEPGHPEQNGRHERMHRTLKEATARPPRASILAQQRAFGRFRREYNQERPHQALGDKPPATVYRPSPRPFPEKLPELVYPAGYEVRLIRKNGCLRWRGRRDLFITEALGGLLVGFEPIDDGLWTLWFSGFPVGVLDEAAGRVIRHLYRPGNTWEAN